MLTLLGAGQGQVLNFIDIIVNDFQIRVLSDGGTFEAESCLKKQIYDLGGISAEGFIFYNFNNRVVADGGTFEAEQCLITQIQELL